MYRLSAPDTPPVNHATTVGLASPTEETGKYPANATSASSHCVFVDELGFMRRLDDADAPSVFAEQTKRDALEAVANADKAVAWRDGLAALRRKVATSELRLLVTAGIDPTARALVWAEALGVGRLSTTPHTSFVLPLASLLSLRKLFTLPNAHPLHISDSSDSADDSLYNPGEAQRFSGFALRRVDVISHTSGSQGWTGAARTRGRCVTMPTDYKILSCNRLRWMFRAPSRTTHGWATRAARPVWRAYSTQWLSCTARPRRARSNRILVTALSNRRRLPPVSSRVRRTTLEMTIDPTSARTGT